MERPVTQDIDELLGPLRKAYVERLPGHLHTLGDLLQRIRAGEDKWTEMRQLAHRLRGTAGTYGLAAVGDALAEIDERLTAAGLDTPSRVDVDLDVLGALLSRAREAMP